MSGSFAQAHALLTQPPTVYTFEDVESIFGVTYTPEPRAGLQGIPFSKEVLKACAGTHMLFPGLPLSLLDIREKHAAHFYTKSGGWYAEKKQSFSRASVPV